MLFLPCIASILLLAPKLNQGQLVEEKKFQEEIQSISSVFKSSGRQPAHCISSTNLDRSLLFVSTADGKFTSLNALTGDVVWSFSSHESLISSSISTVKSINDLTEALLIPSLNGNLYKWTGETLETLPISTDYLVGQLKTLPDGSFVVGGNEVTIQGLDIDTGEIFYRCSLTGCHPVDRDGSTIKHKNILSLRRTQKTVRAIEKLTGKEKWNFSVGNFEMDLIEGEGSEVKTSCEPMSELKPINFIMQEGIVTSSDDGWSFKFSSPITGAWKLDNNNLRKLNIFPDNVFWDETMKEGSLMYLGIYKGQMYVQQPPQKEYREIDTFSAELDSKLLPQVGQWRPLISTSPSRTPFLNNNKKKTTALSSVDYPFDNGFFLYKNNTALALPVFESKDDVEDDICPSSNPDVCKNINDNDSEEYHIELVPLRIFDWWKEILAISIILAFGFNISARFLKRKLGFIEAEESKIVEAEEAIEELPQPIVSKRFKTKSVSLETDTNEEEEESFEVIGSSLEYTSRYMIDFEHVQCLGKGGFGVVFKAKKKIDDYEYAIKRICLPRCDDAKTRMMREVRALAALEHPGIVRYFHAWWEEPPKDWQQVTDRNILMKELVETPSYALSEDWVMELEAPLFENANENRSRNSGLQKDLSGSCYDFNTDNEDFFIPKDFDLLRYNDVFVSNESAGELSSNGDSFIMFERTDESKNESDDSDYSSNVGYTSRRLNTLTSMDNGDENLLFLENEDATSKKDINSQDGEEKDSSCNDVNDTSTTSHQKSRRRLVGT